MVRAEQVQKQMKGWVSFMNQNQTAVELVKAVLAGRVAPETTAAVVRTLLGNNETKPGLTLYSRESLAEIMGVTPITVIRWQKSGRLTPTKVSHKCVRYTQEAVDRFLTQSTVA